MLFLCFCVIMPISWWFSEWMRAWLAIYCQGSFSASLKVFPTFLSYLYFSLCSISSFLWSVREDWLWKACLCLAGQIRFLHRWSEVMPCLHVVGQGRIVMCWSQKSIVLSNSNTSLNSLCMSICTYICICTFSCMYTGDCRDRRCVVLPAARVTGMNVLRLEPVLLWLIRLWALCDVPREDKRHSSSIHVATTQESFVAPSQLWHEHRERVLAFSIQHRHRSV